MASDAAEIFWSKVLRDARQTKNLGVIAATEALSELIMETFDRGHEAGAAVERARLEAEIGRLAVALDYEMSENLRLKTELSNVSAENVRLREALTDSTNALKEMAEWHGSAHQSDCPADDTCDCARKPFNDRVNSAIRNGDSVLATPAPPPQPRESEE